MSPEESIAWRPSLPGWSDDILPFYKRMARELGPGRPQCVEVGVAWGRSILFLAAELLALGKSQADLWAIDSWDPCWDYAPEATPRAAWRFPRPHMLRTLLEHALPLELDMVHLVRAPSGRAARMFQGSSLDLVFIDGDQSFAGVAEDLAHWGPKMARGAVLAGHDHNFPDVADAVDSFAASDSVHLFFEPLTVEGTVWILKRKSS